MLINVETVAPREYRPAAQAFLFHSSQGQTSRHDELGHKAAARPARLGAVAPTFANFIHLNVLRHANAAVFSLLEAGYRSLVPSQHRSRGLKEFKKV